MDLHPTVFVVDDDPGVKEAMVQVTNYLGLSTEAYSSAESFLEHYESSRAGCLILDFKMPGMSGLDLQKKLMQMGDLLPVIMISGHADIRTAVAAIRQGAVTFLEKPFALDDICKEINSALELDKCRRLEAAEQKDAANKMSVLTKKEREVCDRVSKGMTNKEIAKELDISVRAVEDRRARMMKKLRVEYLSEVIGLTSKVQQSLSLIPTNFPHSHEAITTPQ